MSILSHRRIVIAIVNNESPHLTYIICSTQGQTFTCLFWLAIHVLKNRSLFTNINNIFVSELKVIYMDILTSILRLKYPNAMFSFSFFLQSARGQDLPRSVRSLPWIVNSVIPRTKL